MKYLIYYVYYICTPLLIHHYVRLYIYVIISCNKFEIRYRIYISYKT